jgi:hypothetical protein
MSNKLIHIRPLKGLRIPHPLSRKELRQTGEWVERTTYWIRRLHQGDVEIVPEEIVEVKNVEQDVPTKIIPESIKKEKDNG